MHLLKCLLNLPETDALGHEGVEVKVALLVVTHQHGKVPRRQACLPSRDFPMLVSHYKQGNLDLDAFVTERIGLGEVEQAFEKMHSGAVLRSVVVL